MKNGPRSVEAIDARIQSPNSRRVNKQVMERRRRARINSCLEQIKDIVLEGLEKDPSQFEKLEKADILEMTVQYLERHRNKHDKGNNSILFEHSGLSTSSTDSPANIRLHQSVFSTPSFNNKNLGANSCSSTENSPPEDFNPSITVHSMSGSSTSPDSMLHLCRESLGIPDTPLASSSNSYYSSPLAMTNTPMGPPNGPKGRRCDPDSTNSVSLWRPW